MLMKSLVISPDFTIEDIHKIREQNYESENENVKNVRSING